MEGSPKEYYMGCGAIAVLWGREESASKEQSRRHIKHALN
jgi:hypothetical protein